MLIRKNIPFKTVKLVGYRISTIPFRILKIIRLKKAAWKKFIRTFFRLDYLTFQKLASRCRSEVRSYRLTTEMKVLQAASFKSFYAYINRTIPLS